MRAFYLKYGIAIHQGAGTFKVDMPCVLGDMDSGLTPAMRRLLTEVFGELGDLEQRIVVINREMKLSKRAAIRPVA